MQGQALVIGVGADLPVTVKDAEGLASILTDHTRCNFATERVNLLTADAATRENIPPAHDVCSVTAHTYSARIAWSASADAAGIFAQ